MEKLACILADYLVEKNSILKENYEVYKYGFQTGMEMMLCIATSLLIAMRLHMVIECIVFFVVFILLRSYAGGLHLESFVSCFCCSCLVQAGTLLLSKNFQLTKYQSIFIILCMVLIIEVLEPVNNINRLTDKDEQRYFSRKLKNILCGIATISVLLAILNWDYYLSLIAIIMLVIVISMVLGKWKYQRDKKINKT